MTYLLPFISLALKHRTAWTKSSSNFSNNTASKMYQNIPQPVAQLIKSPLIRLIPTYLSLQTLEIWLRSTSFYLFPWHWLHLEQLGLSRVIAVQTVSNIQQPSRYLSKVLKYTYSNPSVSRNLKNMIKTYLPPFISLALTPSRTAWTKSSCPAISLVTMPNCLQL